MDVFPIFDRLQNCLNSQNLFIFVALTLGDMLRHSGTLVFFFFLSFYFQFERKQTPKEADSFYSHSYLWDLFFWGTDVIKKKKKKKKEDDILVTQSFFALSSFILY